MAELRYYNARAATTKTGIITFPMCRHVTTESAAPFLPMVLGMGYFCVASQIKKAVVDNVVMGIDFYSYP